MLANPAQAAWIERVLGIRTRSDGSPSPPAAATASGPTASAGTAPAGKPSLVELQKSRLAWDALRKTIQSQLQSLEQEILAAVRRHNAAPEAEDSFDEAAVTAGLRQLHGILDRLDNRLIDALDAALGAEGAALAEHQAKARAVIADYIAFVDSDPMVADIDANGFIPTAIKATAQKTLGVLAQRL